MDPEIVKAVEALRATVRAGRDGERRLDLVRVRPAKRRRGARLKTSPTSAFARLEERGLA